MCTKTQPAEQAWAAGSKGWEGQRLRLAMTLFRIVRSSKTLISISCSRRRVSSIPCLLSIPLVAIPPLLPKRLCLSHKTSGCHCISCMPRRVWVTAGCPFPKSAPVTPPLGAAGLSRGRDGLVCRMGLSERGVGWSSHGQGSRPIPCPGQGPPELGAAIPTSPASCWNMFLKPSSMSSSVISSWGDAGQKEEVSGQTWALPCHPGSGNPNWKGSSSLFFSSLLLPTSPSPRPCQPFSSHTDTPNPGSHLLPAAPPPKPYSLSTNRTKAAAPTSSARSAEISSSSSLGAERRKPK